MNKKKFLLLFSGILLLLILLTASFTAKTITSSLNKKNKKSKKEIELNDGDIIFHSSTYGQGLAVQLATGSKYSHVGIIFKEKDRWMVYEAVQPVQVSTLENFKARGDEGHYVIKRLKEGAKLINDSTTKVMLDHTKNYLGKDYDLYFEWSDERIYCSELVWKIYKNALDIEIGTLQQLKSFNLSSPVVKEKLKERYGSNIPMEEWVISPGVMFNDDQLIVVDQN